MLLAAFLLTGLWFVAIGRWMGHAEAKNKA
jgi:hypothetical protein